MLQRERELRVLRACIRASPPGELDEVVKSQQPVPVLVLSRCACEERLGERDVDDALVRLEVHVFT